jgi:excisionase family DNA binding protein
LVVKIESQGVKAMRRSSGITSLPNIVVHVAPAITPRRFTIVQLAQYLGITNLHAEELLRNGDIKFKWAGQHKVVERADADAWADAQPYGEGKRFLVRAGSGNG